VPLGSNNALSVILDARLRRMYRGQLFLENPMNKSQRPLRSIWDELFDCSWHYQKREEVQDAYRDFWETLGDDLKFALDSLLY